MNAADTGVVLFAGVEELAVLPQLGSEPRGAIEAPVEDPVIVRTRMAVRDGITVAGREVLDRTGTSSSRLLH